METAFVTFLIQLCSKRHTLKLTNDACAYLESLLLSKNDSFLHCGQLMDSLDCILRIYLQYAKVETSKEAPHELAQSELEAAVESLKQTVSFRKNSSIFLLKYGHLFAHEYDMYMYNTLGQEVFWTLSGGYVQHVASITVPLSFLIIAVEGHLVSSNVRS